MSKAHRVGGCWITKQQRLLLRAALLSGQDAIHAWENWIANVDIDRIDTGSYRLLPLLYHNLHIHQIDHPLMQKLRGTHRAAWYKNQMLFKRLCVFVKAFESIGIKTLVLKGAALIVFYYKDFGMRPMADCDVMIPEEQVATATNILKERNWRPLYVWPNHLQEERRHYVHADTFVDQSGFVIDLHWHAISTCLEKGADNDFWNSAIPIQLDGIPTLALNSTDQLFHVCAHGGMRWDPLPGLRWVADAMMILNSRREIDWDRLVHQTEKRRLALPMKETLIYLHEEFAAPIPANVLQNLEKLPVTRGERLEHKAKTCQIPRNPVLELWMRFSHYKRVKSHAGLIMLLLGFPHYLQVIWRINHLWQLPFYVLYKSMRRLRQIANWYWGKLFDYLSFSTHTWNEQ